MNTLVEDQFGRLTHDPATKFFRFAWLPGAGDMTADDFKHSLTVVADAALAHSPESLLVDVRGFRPNPALMDLNPWRVQNIVPKYNQVLKRFAWLADNELPELPGAGNVYQADGEAYQSRWFGEEAAAVSWATTEV